MEIVTSRIMKGFESTLGLCIVDGIVFGYVLEDQDKLLSSSMPLPAIRAAKVYGRTAIPYGKYEVGLTVSTKFGGRLWPELLNVPGYSGIRPHAGNYVKDTLGCQLVGSMTPKPSKDSNGYWRVWDSQKAFSKLHLMIDETLHRGERVTWEVKPNYSK